MSDEESKLFLIGFIGWTELFHATRGRPFVLLDAFLFSPYNISKRKFVCACNIFHARRVA